jgi:hypothetical protein
MIRYNYTHKGVFMGQNNNEGKINLVQLVLLGLGSLIGSGWLVTHTTRLRKHCSYFDIVIRNRSYNYKPDNPR